MRYYKLTYYILIFSIIFISCEDDKTGPSIEITSPIENLIINRGDQYKLEAIISDDKELDFVNITIIGPDQTASSNEINLEGTSQVITQDLDLEYTVSGPIEIKLLALDKAGNGITVNQTIQFNYFEVGKIDFNVKLQYNGEPLVMFEDYTYPEGGNIDFTRISFYTSEMKLDETIINQVEFHNLTNSHADSEAANGGYSWSIESIPTGSYDMMSFNIGVPEDLNKMDPGEFPSGHPLAKPAENWFSWMSYIFLKVEGNIDLDNDGDNETGVAIHTGADDALRNIQIPYSIQINNDETTSVELVFDIYTLFKGTDRIYPIAENPQIHSLSQLDAVVELSNNLITTINKI